jgi:signal transduction histidine kinase
MACPNEYRRAVEGHTPWSPGQPAPQPIVVPDVRRDESLRDYRPVFARENIRALAFIPLVSRQRTIGKFMLYWDRPHTPPREALDAAMTIGALIGLAVDRARQNAEIQRQEALTRAALAQEAEARERLTRLAEGAQRLQIWLDAESVTHEVLNLARNAIPADGYAVWRLADDIWRVAASYGLDQEFTHVQIPAPEAFRLNGPVIAEDVQAVPLLGGRVDAYRRAGIRSLLSIPLEIRARLGGAIAFYYKQPHRPGELEVRIAQALGQLAAAAIGSAELFTDQQRSRQLAVKRAARAAFLAELSARLSTLDYEKNLATIADQVVPRFADWCVVDLLEAGELRRLAIAHTDPDKVEFARELHRRYPPDRSDRGGIWRVIRTGEPLLYEHIDEALLEQSARGSEHLAMLRELGLRSAMLVPLKRGTEVFGVLSFVLSTGDARYDREDLDFAQELARRASFAIENARLYRQAQDANRAKDEFLAALSHELRTPLNAILGWASILQANPGGQIARGLEVIYRNAKVQAELVDDLLDASRIVSGRLSLDLKDVALRPIVEAALETILPAAAEKDIGVDVMLPVPDVRLRADASRLQQVFWNILHNAVKFTPRGGRVTVRAEVGGSEIALHITDTGAGIRPEALPFIFDRFKQADSSSTTRRFRGLGLGLTLARQLTEMHGGRIAASSPGAGLGATLTVTLPIVERPAPTMGSAQERPPKDALAGVRILAVDDDPDSLEVIVALLRLHQAEVVPAASATDALERLRSERVDLVISDIAMPDHDGYWLRRQGEEVLAEAGRRVPWIALTAFANAAARDRALAEGFADHLSKPVDPDELVRVIRPLLH